MGLIPGGLHRNREFRMNMLEIDPGVPNYVIDSLFDPQTWGGLLISVPGQKRMIATGPKQTSHKGMKKRPSFFHFYYFTAGPGIHKRCLAPLYAAAMSGYTSGGSTSRTKNRLIGRITPCLCGRPWCHRQDTHPESPAGHSSSRSILDS